METTSALSNPTRLITVLSWRSCMLCGGSACASKNSCAPPAGTTYHKLPIGASFTSATAHAGMLATGATLLGGVPP